MAKKNNWVNSLVSERYFVWAVIATVVVGAVLLGQLSVANVQFDSDSTSASLLTVPHTSPIPVHRKK